MNVLMKDYYFFVSPDEKAFRISSNYANYIELGKEGITDYYLEALIENDDFIINAVLHDPAEREPCNITNSVPGKSNFIKITTPEGYHIKNKKGQLLFGIERKGNLCLLRGKIMDLKGNVIAEDVDDDFLIYQGPAILGKSGNARGLVLEG